MKPSLSSSRLFSSLKKKNPKTPHTYLPISGHSLLSLPIALATINISMSTHLPLLEISFHAKAIV